MLNVLLDAIGELMVGVGDALDRVDDSVPWGLEDTMATVSLRVIMVLQSGQTYPSSDWALGTLKAVSLRKP